MEYIYVACIAIGISGAAIAVATVRSLSRCREELSEYRKAYKKVEDALMRANGTVVKLNRHVNELIEGNGNLKRQLDSLTSMKVVEIMHSREKPQVTYTAKAVSIDEFNKAGGWTCRT